MKGKLRYVVAVVSILMLASMVAPVFASTNKQPAKVDLTGVWAFNDDGYMHTMIISSFNPCTGAFSGTGYYNADPALTWVITGTETGDSVLITYSILTGGDTPGVTLLGTGTMSSPTSMGGTGSQSNFGAVTWSATKATEVVNISWLVLNDEDYRWGAGCWALDSGLMSVQVWQMPDGSWVAIKNYNEIFYTPKGAISPVAGTVESKAGTGTMNAQYVVSFTGTLAAGLQLTGCLGLKNYGGTVADILLGVNALGVTGYNWRAQYFPSATNVVYHSDSWTYTLLCDKTAVASSLVETGVYTLGGINPVAVGDIIT